jgi:superfamily I DNA/RNA helicase
MRQFRHIATNGFLTQNSDAIFIDEVQDFNEAWLRFLLSSVRPGRGGVSIAGDSNQALYTTFDQTSLVADFNIQQIRLLKPYRSTKQIVEFVDALSVRGTYDDSDKLIPEGPKPSLVYVPRHRDYVKIAEAVASDIYEVMAANDKLRFSDIAVLCTTQYVIRGFSGKFRDALAQRFGHPVPTTPIWPRAGFLLDTRENSIKILTLHGAKGLEFAHIAMIGLEEIPDQSEEALEADGDFRGNYYLIGPTRAKDTLAIYYSKDNIYLERLLGHEELFTMRAYPDDY